MPRKPAPDPHVYNLAELIDQYRLTPRRIAQITGRPDSTARRWFATQTCTPEAHRLIQIEAGGTLPSRCTSWHGWTIHGRWLVDNDGGCYEATEIKSRWLVWQMVRSARKPHNEPPIQLRLF